MNQTEIMEMRMQRYEAKLWWLNIQEFWDVVVEKMSLARHATDDDFTIRCRDELREVYYKIQCEPCPNFADMVFTYVTRTTMNLIQTFDAISQYDYPEADYTYQQVQDAYHGVYRELEAIGIYV